MYPKSFEYFDPETLNDVFQLLETYKEDAKIMAGGQSLIPLMKLRIASPKVIIDLARVPELAFIRETHDSKKIEIGALTTHYQIESSQLLKKMCPILSDAASVIGDTHIRNKGTIGGSIVHADPAADLLPCLLALEAEFVIRGNDGERMIPANEFFVDYFETAIEKNEILSKIRVPTLHTGEGSAYLKLSTRGTDFAIVGAAAYLKLKGADKIVDKCRVALGGVAKKPIRSIQVENAMMNKKATVEVIGKASELLARELDPPSDVHASRDYRLKTAQVYMRRSLELALQRAVAQL